MFDGIVCDVIVYSGPNDCYEGNGELYRGFISETVEELECVPWNYHRIPVVDFKEKDGIGPHNYCRYGFMEILPNLMMCDGH